MSPFLQKLWDFVGVPFRLVLFDQAWLPAFGWSTLEEQRIRTVLPHVDGELLDIGAGFNTLVNEYGSGVGVDVFDWKGGALVVEDTAKLPFKSETFDTVTFVACLNHIPNRGDVLKEAGRLLRQDGKIIITMIGPLLGDFGHAIWWYSEDKHRGGMKEGEVGGMTTKDIVELCAQAGFTLVHHERFVYGMNNLYVFKRA
ncbi:MAG: methyltransferase domain-containing protein [Anaerolineales bacterium]|nr:methyltransferase domain-containing protein [Anaerolineales bacterium]